MKHIGRIALSLHTLVLFNAIILASLLVARTAMADGGPAPPTTGALWPMVALLVCQLIAYGIRAGAPAEHLLHTKWGAALIALVSAVLGAIEPVLESGSLNGRALAWAAGSGALSFFTTSNPSLDANNMSKRPDPPGTVIKALLFLPLFSALVALPGCAETKKVVESPQFVGALNCSAPIIQDAIKALGDDVRQALSGPSPNWENLIGLELKYGFDVVACAVSQFLTRSAVASASTAHDNVAANARVYIKSRLASTR